LALGHQLLAGKGTIGAEQNSHPRPAAADVADDPPHLLLGTGERIDVRTPQPGGEQVPAAEHVERQITVAIVVAAKEAAFLVPVQRIVGGVQVKDDLLRRPAMGIKEQVDEQPFASPSWPILW
jgi:hypothetical protein